MKGLISLLTACVLLTACATHYQYQAEKNPTQFKGQNISVVQQQWGSADQVMHTRSGTSFYVYSTNSSGSIYNTVNSPYTTTNHTGIPRGEYTGDLALECATIFKTDSTGMIIDTWHKGSNCGGEWVAKKKQTQ